MPETPNIPQDIIIDILRRLPAKPIARFRCVSKPWLSMLTDSNFINHVNKNRENHKLLVVYPSLSLHALTLTPQNHYVSRKINFPPSLDPAWFEIVQSCGGLVLAVCNKGMFLINPTNSNFNKIPEIPFNLHPPSFCLYELVYDEYTNHFKIFNLSCYDGHHTFVDVYSLKSSCWTRIGVSPFDHFSCLDPSGVLFHGAIHWPALPEYLHALHAGRDYLPLIAAFDLGTEKFREVELPNDMDGVEFSLLQLLVLDCCLCMIIDYADRSGIYVWMMKEYGVRGSWIKLMRLSNDFDFLIPVRIIGDHDLVVSKGETGGVEIFNVKEGRFRSFIIDGAPAKVRDGWAFVESLVSLNLNC